MALSSPEPNGRFNYPDFEARNSTTASSGSGKILPAVPNSEQTSEMTPYSDDLGYRPPISRTHVPVKECNVLPEILKDPQKLNLLFSAAVLVSGVALYWYHPRVFHQHTFVERAFEFWIFKWFSFVLTWGFLTANTDLRFVLAANDLNSVVGMGLVICLWAGANYSRPQVERHAYVSLIFVFGLLVTWNFVIHPLLGPGPVWIFPSMMTSLLFISSMAFVAVRRYGRLAVPFAIVSLAYLLLQLPTYELVFLFKVKVDPELVKWLAFAKLIYGVAFYTVLMSPLASSHPLTLPGIPISNPRLKSALTWAAGAIGSGLLTEIVLRVGKLIWRAVFPTAALT